MRLYFKYMLIWLKSQMQYRTSFLLLSFGQIFAPFFVFAGLYFMFERFGNIKGWAFFEVALCFAVIHMAFSISECFARGFDSFSSLVVNGEFDRILVRPRNTILQVLGSRMEFNRVGRLLQSVAILIWAVFNVSIEWNILKVLTLIFMVISGTFIFTGLFMLTATLCFWTIQGLEIANIFTDGGREMTQYPLNIYEKWIMRFFTFVVPFGCVNYLPLMYLFDRVEDNDILYMLTPFSGIVFMIFCIGLWNIGVKHYRSTGS